MEQKLKINIKELRKRQGMTQKELAEKMQVSFQAVSKWENGVNMPDILDFGCGYGFLGMKFLPLLPEKSSYTGIEKEKLNQTFRYVFENEDSFQGGRDYFLTCEAGYQKACEYADYYEKIKNYFDSDDSFAVKTSGLYFVYARL